MADGWRSLDHPVMATAFGARAQRSTVVFFAVALGLTWLLQLPALLAAQGVISGPVERYLLPAALGAFGPAIAAVIASLIEGGGAEARALFGRMRIWRMSPIWYVVAFGLFTAIYVVGTAIYRLLGGADAGRWLYPPEHAEHFSAMLVIPFAEEIGWRGFALPRLQARYSPLRASLVLGIVWAAWHTEMFILQGATPLVFAIAIVNIVFGSIVFSWIFNRTRESLLLAIFAHMGVHLNNPFHALPGNIAPFVVYTVSIAVTALALLLIDRDAWAARPPRSTHR